MYKLRILYLLIAVIQSNVPYANDDDCWSVTQQFCQDILMLLLLPNADDRVQNNGKKRWSSQHLGESNPGLTHTSPTCCPLDHPSTSLIVKKYRRHTVVNGHTLSTNPCSALHTAHLLPGLSDTYQRGKSLCVMCVGIAC